MVQTSQGDQSLRDHPNNLPVTAVNSGAAPATLSARHHQEAARGSPHGGLESDQQLFTSNANAVSSSLLVRHSNPGLMTQQEQTHTQFTDPTAEPGTGTIRMMVAPSTKETKADNQVNRNSNDSQVGSVVLPQTPV